MQDFSRIRENLRAWFETRVLRIYPSYRVEAFVFDEVAGRALTADELYQALHSFTGDLVGAARFDRILARMVRRGILVQKGSAYRLAWD